MPQASNPTKILDDQYLLVRAKLIEVAAVLDRIDRAAEAQGDLPSDLDPVAKRAAIEQAIQLLLRGAVDPGQRAEAIQRLLSRTYNPNWRDTFGV